MDDLQMSILIQRATVAVAGVSLSATALCMASCAGVAAERVLNVEYSAAAATFLPAPWTDGEEMRLDLKFSSGMKVASAAYAVNSGETNDVKIWRLSNRIFGASRSLSQVEVDADTFRPLHSRWKHNLFGEADAQYTNDEATVLLKGKDQAKKIALNGAAYDNEEAIQLMRRLPLDSGYKTSLRLLSTLSAGSIVPVQVTVTGPEKIIVSAGSFDCYKVALSIHQTFWYSADAHRYLVKYEAGGAIAELTQVAYPEPGQPEKYQDPELGFSLTVPYDWRLSPRPVESNTNTAFVDIFDPEMTATTFLKVRKLDTLSPAARKTVRTWAQSEAVEFAKAWRNFKVRPDSWQARMIAGRDGASFVGDYVDTQTNKVVLAAFTFGEMNAAEFVMQTTPQDLNSMRPKFNTVLDGYQAK
jgi:hypothetical protein